MLEWLQRQRRVLEEHDVGGIKVYLLGFQTP
jgi:hypothetical protein